MRWSWCTSTAKSKALRPRFGRAGCGFRPSGPQAAEGGRGRQLVPVCWHQLPGIAVELRKADFAVARGWEFAEPRQPIPIQKSSLALSVRQFHDEFFAWNWFSVFANQRYFDPVGLFLDSLRAGRLLLGWRNGLLLVRRRRGLLLCLWDGSRLLRDWRTGFLLRYRLVGRRRRAWRIGHLLCGGLT